MVCLQLGLRIATSKLSFAFFFGCEIFSNFYTILSFNYCLQLCIYILLIASGLNDTINGY